MPDNNTIRGVLAGTEGVQQTCTEAEHMLPCPFCGGEAGLLSYGDDEYLPACTKCEGMIEYWFLTREQAIKHWNRRARVSGRDNAQWIKCSERLPMIRHAVIVHEPHYKNSFVAAYHEDGRWYYFGAGVIMPIREEITHWMPLPEGPEEDV